MRTDNGSQRWRKPSCWILLGGLCLVLGCVGSMAPTQPGATSLVPRETVEASIAQDRIEVSDVLHFKLGDGSAVSVTQQMTVGPDGNIELSGYGKIQVAGKTVAEAREAVRQALDAADAARMAFELAPMEYYLVANAPDGSREVVRVPLKGTLLVSDALRGLPKPENKVVWVVRPSLQRLEENQILPVDWQAINNLNDPATNYELRPGDWLFAVDEPKEGLGRVVGAFTSMMKGPASKEAAPPIVREAAAPPETGAMLR